MCIKTEACGKHTCQIKHRWLTGHPDKQTKEQLEQQVAHLQDSPRLMSCGICYPRVLMEI